MRKDGKAQVIEIRTLWSRALGKWVEIQTLAEEDVLYVLDQVDLANLTYDQYRLVVLNAWPGLAPIFADLPKTRVKKVADELWPLLLDANPVLAPEHIVKHEVIKIERKPRAKAEATAKGVPAGGPEKAQEAVKPLPRVQDVRKVVSQLSGELEKNVVGQGKALREVVGAIGKSMLSKERGRRPVASLFFAGQSGVGKTEVARQLAIALGGGEDRLIQVNCGEYSESHTAARLIGAPPGYVGYESGGLLQNKIKKDGRIQVLLFDEFEKAHPRLQHLLLAAMEDGMVDSGNNKRVDLTQCLIILTSNIGAELWRKAVMGFQASDSPATGEARVIERLRKELPIEFINRLTSVIVFNDLAHKDLEAIAELQVCKVKGRMDHLVTLTWSDEVTTYLAQNLPKGQGARPIRTRAEHIESVLCDYLIGSERDYEMIALKITPDGLSFSGNGDEQDMGIEL